MIQRDDIDDVIVLRMDHGKANAMDLEFCQALIGVLDELEAHDSRPVVLTGSGRIFSAGVDLIRVVNEDNAYLEAFYPVLVDAFTRLFAFQRPLVAAVNSDKEPVILSHQQRHVVVCRVNDLIDRHSSGVVSGKFKRLPGTLDALQAGYDGELVTVLVDD